jgi:hypothetical protein
LRGELLPQPFRQTNATVGRASLVREDATRDAVQPRKRIAGRDGIEPAPGDKESLGHGVGRILGTRCST